MTETLQSGLADLEEGRVSDYVPRKSCKARIWVDGWEKNCVGPDDHTGKHRCKVATPVPTIPLDLAREIEATTPGTFELTIVWDQ